MLYSGSTVKTITVPPLRCSSPNFDTEFSVIRADIGDKMRLQPLPVSEDTRQTLFGCCKRFFSADSLFCLRDIFFQISSHDYHKGRSGNFKVVHFIHFKAYVVVIYILTEVMP